MGGNQAKNKREKIIEGDFVDVDKFSGEVDEFGERKGEGIYCYKNGDIYDGDWKNGMKHGWGIYTYADGKSLKGWFYKDRFIGSQPNAKLRKQLKIKKKKAEDDEASPLPPPPSLLFSPPEEENISQPLSMNTFSSSHEDVSTDKHTVFRRIKSERKPKNFFRTNYKLPSKEEEMLERQRSIRLRKSIREKYGLPTPSRKNPLLSESGSSSLL